MTKFQNDKWQECKISLSQLVLWEENARFPDKYFTKSEKELIKHFCNEKNFKIEELAKEIVNDFDLPQLEKLIIYDTDEQKIVLEGNRRLTVYKLLNDPNLAPNDALKNKFIKLKQDIDINDSFSLDCLVTKNKAEGYRYIERKHIKRNNEVGWNEQERTNHNYRRGNATKKEQFKVAIAKIIKELDIIPEKLKEQVLGPGYVTTFWRILDSPPAQQEYGFKLKDDDELEIQDKDFKEKLKVIILNVLEKEDFSGEKVDSRSLNTKDKIGKYIKSITNDQFEQVKIDARFTKKTVIERLQKIKEFKNKIEVCNFDGIKFLHKLEQRKNAKQHFIFLDPPYFQKGQSLYLNHYNEADHEKLSKFLEKSSFKKWIMTYDDVLYINNLYAKMRTRGFSIQHNAYKSKVGREIMIFPKDFVLVKI